MWVRTEATLRSYATAIFARIQNDQVLIDPHTLRSADENFIKTMVAGASGIDGVIFVIAADDGVMPQTREHLDILTLLGVKHGFVALYVFMILTACLAAR